MFSKKVKHIVLFHSHLHLAWFQGKFSPSSRLNNTLLLTAYKKRSRGPSQRGFMLVTSRKTISRTFSEGFLLVTSRETISRTFSEGFLLVTFRKNFFMAKNHFDPTYRFQVFQKLHAVLKWRLKNHKSIQYPLPSSDKIIVCQYILLM